MEMKLSPEVTSRLQDALKLLWMEETDVCILFILLSPPPFLLPSLSHTPSHFSGSESGRKTWGEGTGVTIGIVLALLA